MSDTFVSLIPIAFPEVGTPTTTSSGAERLAVPFNYELVGIWASLGVAPSNDAVVVDIVRNSVNGTEATSIFALAGDRLTISTTKYAPSALVVPTAAGPVSTYTEGPIKTPGDATVDPAPPWGTGIIPENLAGSEFTSAYGLLLTPPAPSYWAYPSGEAAEVQEYLGLAYDSFQMNVTAADTAGAARDLLVVLWVTKR